MWKSRGRLNQLLNRALWNKHQTVDTVVMATA